MPKGNAIAAAVLAASNAGGNASGASSPGALSPLVASYSQGYNASVPYSPLPRPAPVFLNGAFGPMAPITAMPIDPPREDTGRPDVRRYQYEPGYNLPVGQPGSEGLKLAPFATLRAVVDKYSVARSCVDKRKAEIIGLEPDVIPTPEAEHAMAGDDSLRTDWEKRRATVLEFFSHPDSDRAKYPTLGAWLSALLEDRFVLDAVAIHLVPPRKKGAGPFGSDLAALNLIDGSTVRPLISTLGETPRPSAVGYQQFVWGVPRVDLLSVINGDDLDELSEPVADYRADQLIYMRETPRAFTPYGQSLVEKALLPISIGLARQQFQNDYFTDGSIPGQFITPGPDISTPQQIRQLQDALNAMAGDIGAKHRIVVLPPGSKAEAQKPVALADQFDEWIISQVAMPFGLTPMDLGVTPRVSAVQSPSESRELSQINSDAGSQTRVEPVCASLKTVLFDFVIQEVFGQKDMEWSWGLTDRGKNRQSLIDQGVQLTQGGVQTIDEFRGELGWTPFGLPETSVPLVFTATGPVPLSAIAGEQPLAIGSPPAAGNAPARVTDDDLTTPAHEAAQDLPDTPGRGGAGDAESKAAELAAQKAELEILGRYLRKGRDLTKFRPEALPAEAVEAAARMLPQGVPAAVKAAKDAADAKQRQDRREQHLKAAAAAVAAQLGQLVREHRDAGLALPNLIDHGVKAMASGYRQAMAAGSADASGDYGNAPPLDAAGLDQDARQDAESQRGYLMGLLQDVVAGLSLAAIGARLALFASTLYEAYNRAYGRTVEATYPDFEIVWELGSTEHCEMCLDRAGKVFTFRTLPGYPGDGGFGDVCEGGPRCGCSLTYRRVDPDADTAKASAVTQLPPLPEAARGLDLDVTVDRVFAKVSHLDITKSELRTVIHGAAGDIAKGGGGITGSTAPGLTQRSGMISLDLNPGAIPVTPGGLEDHHVTIVYLGPDVDDEAFTHACGRAAAAAAAMPGPVSGVIGGLGTFAPSAGSDGLTPAFAEVQMPGAHELRAHLADLSASEHADYHPHVTLKYLEEGESPPEPVPPTPVTFTQLSVHRGGDVTRFPLGGQ